MLHDLRGTLGPDTLRMALRDLMDQNRYGVVEPAEFRRTAQSHSPVDLTPLWRRWRNDRN